MKPWITGLLLRPGIGSAFYRLRKGGWGNLKSFIEAGFTLFLTVLLNFLFGILSFVHGVLKRKAVELLHSLIKLIRITQDFLSNHFALSSDLKS